MSVTIPFQRRRDDAPRSAIGHDGVLDLPAVARYVAGWQACDGAGVWASFAPDGGYFDPSLASPLTGAAIAAHVELHRGAQLRLDSARQTEHGDIELGWTLRWPDPRGESSFTDVLRLKQGAIAFVNSSATADAAAQQLVKAYERWHNQPTSEGMAALFSPCFVVHGSTIPESGLQGEAYLDFLRSLKGTLFSRRPGSRVLQTKDKRLVLHWTLQAGSKQLAAGIDYLTLEGGRISRIVGIY